MMKCQKNDFFSNCSLLDLFFREVDGSNSVVKHDKKDKRHVKKSRKGGFFYHWAVFVFRYNQMLRIKIIGLVLF